MTLVSLHFVEILCAENAKQWQWKVPSVSGHAAAHPVTGPTPACFLNICYIANIQQICGCESVSTYEFTEAVLSYTTATLTFKSSELEMDKDGTCAP